MILVVQELGKHVENVKSWNPQQASSNEMFSYIDLSSIDKDKKVIDLTQIQRIVSVNAPSRARQIVKKSDILVSTVRPNLNGVAFVPDDLDNATASTGYCVLRANEKTLSAQYLFHWVQSNSFINEMVSKATGANYPAVSDKIIKQSKIPLPPLAEQQKIAAILDAADSLRQKDQQLVERYTALSQSLFLEMFGDPVTNPMGWERKRISDVCLKVTDGTHQSPKFTSEGIPFLLVSNIVNNQINFKTKKFISELDYDALTKNTAIEKNDILYTSVGSYGNPAIVEADIKFCFQRHIAHLKPNHKIINVKFLHAMLLSNFVKNQADKLARGVAQKTLNLKEIKSLEIYLPSYSTQNQFAERIQLIEAQKQQAQLSLAKSEALFNSLLQRAFTGELTAKLVA